MNQETFTCPMHPEIVRDKPGMCPECGMALVKIRKQKSKSKDEKTADAGGEHAEGHNKHEGHSTEEFLKKFWVCLALTIPIVLYSDLPQAVLGWSAPDFQIGMLMASSWISAILGSIVFVWGGKVFLAGAYREIRGRLPGMMTLIALAISAAYVYSVWVFVRNVLSSAGGIALPGEHALFWELATLITIMLLGHYLEMRAVKSAQGALRELAKLLPDEAERISQKSKVKSQNENTESGGGASRIETEKIPLTELREGDVVLVRPGGKVPADGSIIDGRSDLNEALLTGESKPVSKTVGDQVIAGSINGDGALRIRVDKIGEKTFLSGVMRLVADAQASKSRLQILSDRAAFLLTIIAVVVGGVTFAAWTLVRGDVAFAVSRLVAVLVIACPHALGLAVPLVASLSTTLAARHGFLIRQRMALEAARSVNVVLFDKTGTLTAGSFGVAEVLPITNDPLQVREVLAYAASANALSEHPIARAIVVEAKKRDIHFPEAKEFERVAGRGVRAKIPDGKTDDRQGEIEVLVGSETLVSGVDAKNFGLLRQKIEQSGSQGRTAVYVAAGGILRGAILLDDTIRPESREAVAALRDMDVRVAMITGDSEESARAVARELGIDEYFARVLPGEKAEIVRNLQNPKHETGNSKQIQSSNVQNSKQFRISNLEFRNSTNRRFVAMVGDGVNDAPALTQADVGIAIGAGTNVAVESAGIVLVRNDPRDIPKIIRLSRATYRKMIENLFWATGYNVVAMPLAAGILAAKGIILEPAAAAFLMSVSTVVVAINALLLKRVKL